jgi:uncharacterized iron-regulated membrane protein
MKEGDKMVGRLLWSKIGAWVFSLIVLAVIGSGCVSDQQIREHREAAEAAMKAAQAAAARVEAAAERVEAAVDRAEAAAARSERTAEKCERIFQQGLRK